MSTPLQAMAELLIQKSVFGLDQKQQQQLQKLRLENNVSESDLRNEMERFDLAAAAADLALFEHQSSQDAVASMPEHLRSCVLVEAGKYFESQASELPTTSASLPANTQTGFNPWMIATALATAACLWLLISPMVTGTNNDAPISVARKMNDFLASDPADLMDLNMVPGFDATGKGITSGRLVWSDSRQEGYMDFTGLKINDPKVEQYQLWIFDDSQEHPIDGGVFDITRESQIIKIDPNLIAKAKSFAVTVEKPGGVVVSDQQRIATADADLADAVAASLKSDQ